MSGDTLRSNYAWTATAGCRPCTSTGMTTLARNKKRVLSVLAKGTFSALSSGRII